MQGDKSLTLNITSYDFMKSFLSDICQMRLSLLLRYTILIYILSLSNIWFTMPMKTCSNYLYPIVKNLHLNHSLNAVGI